MVTLNHKTVFGIASWLIFGALLLGRRIYGWRGRDLLDLVRFHEPDAGLCRRQIRAGSPARTLAVVAGAKVSPKCFRPACFPVLPARQQIQQGLIDFSAAAAQLSRLQMVGVNLRFCELPREFRLLVFKIGDLLRQRVQFLLFLVAQPGFCALSPN